MTIEIKHGDIFQSTCQTLVNPVNCVGVMGKGLALEFKKRYPEAYDLYVGDCRLEWLRLGRPTMYQIPEDRYMLAFATKYDWRSKSNIKDIEDGLRFLSGIYSQWRIGSIAFPARGCGEDGLEWDDVLPVMANTLIHCLLE